MAYHYHYGVPPAGYRPFYDSRATSPPFSSNNEYVYYAPGQGLLDTSSTTTNIRLRRTLRKARRRCASLYDSITDAYGTDDKVMGDPWLRLGDLDWVLKRLQMITYDTSRMPVLLPIQDSLHKCAETLKRLKVLVDAYDRTFEPGLAGWTGRRAWKSRTAEFEDLQDFLGLCKDSFEGAVKLGEMLQRTQQQPVVAQKDTISAQVGSVPGNLSSAASAVAGSVSIGTDRGYALKKYLLDDTSIQAWSDQPAHSNKEDASSASDWDDSTSEKSNDNHKDAAMVTSAFQLGRASNLPRGLPGKSRETIRSAGGGSDAFSGSIVPPPYRLENPIETQKTFQSDPTYEDNPIVDVDQLSKTRQRDEVGIEHDLEESQVHFDPSQHCPQCHSGVIGQQYQDRKCSGCGWKGHRLSLPASMNPQDTSKRTASPKGKTRTFGGIEIHYDNSGEPVDSGKVVETKAIMNENDRRVEDDTESRDTKSDASDSDDENPRSIGGGADAQTVKKTIFKGPDFRDSFPTNYIDARSLKHMLTVKAAHAAPTVDVDVDDSNDGGIDWQRVRDRDESLGEQGQAYELEEQQQKYRKSLFTLTNPEEGSDSEVEATQVGGQDTAPTSPAIEEKPPLMTETLKGSSSSESTKTSHYPTTLQEAATDDEVEAFQDYYSFVSFSRNSLVYTLFKYKDGVHDESTPERGDIIKITRMWNQRDKYGGEIWASGLKLVGVSATSPAEKIAKAAAADQGMGALTTFPLPSVCSPEKWATKVQE